MGGIVMSIWNRIKGAFARCLIRLRKENQEMSGSGRPDIRRILCTLVIIVCLYILLQQFGILNLLAPSQLADTKMGYGMLFVIGLITSVHCIAMCGGINLSQCVPREHPDQTRAAEPSCPPSFTTWAVSSPTPRSASSWALRAS